MASHRSFEERKKEFLYEINTSGKYHVLKEKLKKTIVRIVKEHFHKTGSVKGLARDASDHFYSQLYAYLVDQMRAALRELVLRKQNELHENITVPQEQFVRERDFVVQGATGEAAAERYKRLSQENEGLYVKQAEAETCMLKYISLYEGDPEKMLEMGLFYLRNNNDDLADQYLRDAFSFQIKNKDVALLYASYLVQRSRYQEAIVILNKL